MSLHRLSIVAPSGAGKTSLIAGLLRMGYNVRMFAFENAADPIQSFVEPELLSPDRFQYTEYSDNVAIEFRQLKEKGGVSGKKMPDLKRIGAGALSFATFEYDFACRQQNDTVKPGQFTWYVYDSLSSIVVSMINWCQIESGNLRWESRGMATGVFEAFISSYFANADIGANVLILGHTQEAANGEIVLSGLPGVAMRRNFNHYNNSVLSIENSLSGRRTLMTAGRWPHTYLKCPFIGRVPPRIPATLINAAGDIYDLNNPIPGPYFAADGLIRYLSTILPPSSIPPVPDCLVAPLVTDAGAEDSPVPAAEAPAQTGAWAKLLGTT